MPAEEGIDNTDWYIFMVEYLMKEFNESHL